MILNVVVFVTVRFFIRRKDAWILELGEQAGVDGLNTKKQQEYYESPDIVNFRECKLSDTSNLKKFIGFALFDVSEKEPFENLTGKQLKLINKIFDSIERSMKNISVRRIFLCLFHLCWRRQEMVT